MKTITTAVVLTLSALAGCTAALDEADDPTASEGSALGANLLQNQTVRIRSYINNYYHPRPQNKDYPTLTGMCLDVAGGYTGDKNGVGSQVVQYPCHKGANQEWLITNVNNTHQIQYVPNPSLCLGYVGSSWAVDNSQLTLVPCNNQLQSYFKTLWVFVQATQQGTWAISQDGEGSSDHMYKECIDVPSGLDWDSLILQTYTCSLNQGVASPNQQWWVVAF
jgi:hypothetical protein